MNFKGLQDLVSLMLNYTTGGVDSDFTTAQIKASINRGYSREVREAKLQANLDYFKATLEFVWPANAPQFTLTTQMLDTEWLLLEDVTTSSRGSRIELGGSSSEGTIYLLNRTTAAWGTQGPSSARTIRLSYLSRAEDLIDDEDVPALIAPEYHEVIAYSSAVELRAFADEEVPAPWRERYSNFQMHYWKSVSRGRPHIGGDVTVTNRYPEDRGGFSSGAVSSTPQDGGSIGN